MLGLGVHTRAWFSAAASLFLSPPRPARWPGRPRSRRRVARVRRQVAVSRGWRRRARGRDRGRVETSERSARARVQCVRNQQTRTRCVFACNVRGGRLVATAAVAAADTSPFPCHCVCMLALATSTPHFKFIYSLHLSHLELSMLLSFALEQATSSTPTCCCATPTRCSNRPLPFCRPRVEISCSPSRTATLRATTSACVSFRSRCTTQVWSLVLAWLFFIWQFDARVFWEKVAIKSLLCFCFSWIFTRDVI